MASISNDPNGRRRILFVAPDGVRKTIRLGKVSQRSAEGVKYRVEQILEAKFLQRPMEADLAGWVAGLDRVMAKKLAAVGLIPKPIDKVSTTLEGFLADFIDGRADVKPASKLVWGHVRRNLIEFFGADRDVSSITPGDADDFKQHLISEKLASTTIHKRLQFARTFFRAMLRRKVITENPFADVKAPAAGVQDRQRFVTRQEIARVLEACPTQDWRTIVALARYGGLRCPSEVLSLRWRDIDWDAGRIAVTSPKTEHRTGKACRSIPLFPELRPILAEAREVAPQGAEFVVDEKYRKAAMGPGGWANANLRTTFEKIIRRAGLQAWPRLFHNLRASRETELVESFPIQVVTNWLGNTPTIAMRHYLMTTDEHFLAAVEGCAALPPQPIKVAQNAAQQAHVKGCKESQANPPAHEKTPEMPGFTRSCNLLQLSEVEAGGHQ